jgi:hypothetical protein
MNHLDLDLISLYLPERFRAKLKVSGVRFQEDTEDRAQRTATVAKD